MYVFRLVDETSLFRFIQTIINNCFLVLLMLELITPVQTQLLLVVSTKLRPWSTIECSQPATWTTSRSPLVTSRTQAFPGRPTNSDWTLPTDAHLDGGVIECHLSITSHSGSAPASPDMRLTPLALSRMLPIHHLHPCNSHY